MTLPRNCRAGKTYMLVRRIVGRRFYLRPDWWVAELMRYAVARAAEESGVEVVAVVVMSDHVHIVVSDPQARLPQFTELLGGLTARAGNAERGRGGNFWDCKGPQWTELLTPEAVEEMVAYTICNPVKAGLVASAKAWPGWVTLPEDLATESEALRPEMVFFGAETECPAAATLRLKVPITHRSLSPEKWRKRIAKRVEILTEHWRKKHDKKGFVGAEAVMSVNPEASAKTPEEPRASTPAFKIGPVACAAALKASYLEARRIFRAMYREAYLEFRAKGTALFPIGTWRWHIQAGQSILAQAG